MTAKEYLQDIGLENVIDEEFFNDDDKSWYKVQELMESYHQAKLKLLGIGDVVEQSEKFTPKQLFILAHKYNMADFIKILEEAPTWKG